MDRDSVRRNLDDVAKLAGVSLSTVGRVLNERGSVSEVKRKAVLQAAKALGLKRLLPTATHGLLRIDLLIVDSDTDHFRRLNAAFAQQAEIHRSRVVIQRMIWRGTKPIELLNLIKHPQTPRQGIIVIAHDTPEVRLALQEQISKGVSVILLTSGLSDLRGARFVGIDNYLAGKCAARLLIKWVGGDAGSVLLITNTPKFYAHRERINGFLSVMREQPSLVVTPPTECFDLDGHTARAVAAFKASGRHLVGIYNTGAGSDGIRKELVGLKQAPTWIAHEISSEHEKLLREGIVSVVIDQDPEGQAKSAIEHFLFQVGDSESLARTDRQLRIILKEMIPDCI